MDNRTILIAWTIALVFLVEHAVFILKMLWEWILAKNIPSPHIRTHLAKTRLAEQKALREIIEKLAASSANANTINNNNTDLQSKKVQ